jgi:hypothetical protein
VPVGHGQRRRAWVVGGLPWLLARRRGALIFSKEAPDVLWGMARCLWSFGALPELMVWNREGCLHAGGGRPTEAKAGFCEAGDAPAKGGLERLQGYLERRRRQSVRRRQAPESCAVVARVR